MHTIKLRFALWYHLVPFMVYIILVSQWQWSNWYRKKLLDSYNKEHYGVKTVHHHWYELHCSKLQSGITIMNCIITFIYDLIARTHFVVPLDCRNDLARTPYLPACSDLDLSGDRRPPCQLRHPADTMALNAVAALSGDTEVIIDGA